jgi:hypothetical protein
MKGSTTVFGGSLCVLASGLLQPGSTATGLTAAGIAARTVTNSGADGSVFAEVIAGVGKFINSGGDLVVQADEGLNCYITDDQTVNHTSTGKSVAGKVVLVDTDGVWVNVSVY